MRWSQGTIITPAMNHLIMRQEFPGFRHSYDRPTRTSTWLGVLTPSIIGPEYRVRITMTGSKSPKVSVLSPKLVKNAPHIYPDGTLCLYHPADNSWHSGLPIAGTVVPWTAEWLYFYNEWLVTGKWNGSAAAHANNVLEQRTRDK